MTAEGHGIGRYDKRIAKVGGNAPNVYLTIRCVRRVDHDERSVLAIKWFAEQRGMAASVVSAGNGLGMKELPSLL